MAAIIVEDGSGLANSNSYVSEADLGTYVTDRGVTLSGTPAILLIQAMDYIELQRYKGTKGTNDQALQWPRYGVFIDDYSVDSDTIPQLLIDALCEVTIGIDSGTNPLADSPRETIEEVVGDIEVKYKPSSLAHTYLTAANAKLRKLLAVNGSVRVMRA